MTEVHDISEARGRRKRAPQPPSGGDDWRSRLSYTSSGRPRSTIANVVAVLSEHPDWAKVVAFDAFREGVTKVRPAPCRPQDALAEPRRGEWSDCDSVRTCAWLAANVDLDTTPGAVDQAIAAVAERNLVHPVREYLSALTWDGTPRLARMLHSFFGAEDSDYTRAVGTRWMISAVARVMQPGCQVDCMLVLESERQGTGKSTGLEALAGKDWFADTGVVIGDKDSYQVLRGVWVYEWGELTHMRGRDAERIKNYISARSDRYRPSYGRRAIDVPRQCVFAGTTNASEYLEDSTGNRRFWPVRQVRDADVESIRRDRNQLWAEAYRDHLDGKPWHVDTADLRAMCQAEQEDREVRDPWEQFAAPWLRSRLAGGVTTAELLSGCLEIDPGQITRAQQIRAGQVLHVLGWRRRRERVEQRREYRYYPAEVEP